MRYLLDNTLSYRIAQALNALVGHEGHEVRALREIFPEGSEDEEWLPALVEQGDWVVITNDLAKKDKNREIWMRSGLTTFFLQKAWSTGGYQLTDISYRLLKYWPQIVHKASTKPAGTCFSVSINGKISEAS